MIYLFEDRKIRKDKYLLANSLVDKYIYDKAVLSCRKQDLAEYIKENCSDVDLVLIHNSYTFSHYINKKDELTIDYVQDFFNKKGISVIVFSGGFDANNLTYSERSEKIILNGNVVSEDMYSNLPYFLEQYSQINGDNLEQIQLILPILLYGKQYLRNSLLSMQNEIVTYLFDKKNDDVIDYNLKDELIDLIYSHINEVDLIQVKNALIQWVKETSNLTIQMLLGNIQELINQYEEWNRYL